MTSPEETARQIRDVQDRINRAFTTPEVAHALRQFGVAMKDVRTPDLSRYAISGARHRPPGANPAGNPTPTEGPHHPDLTHSAEQEPSVTELTRDREPSPEERREAWLNVVQAIEKWLLATEQRAEQAAHFLAVLEKDVPEYVRHDVNPRSVEAEKARQWAARRVLTEVRLLSPPVVPRDDERGQGSILELFPGADSTAVENPVEEPVCFSRRCRRAHDKRGRHI